MVFFIKSSKCKRRQKSSFTEFVKEIFKKMSASFSNSGDDEILAERVISHPCYFDKTCKEHKEKDEVENTLKKVAKELHFIETGNYSGFLAFGIFSISFCFFCLDFCLSFTLSLV